MEDWDAWDAARAAELEAGLAADERAAQRESFRGQWVRVNATDTARDLIVHSILTPAVAAVDERFADQPVVAAQLRQVLGDRYRELGLYDEAQPLQESALETRRRHSTPPPMTSAKKNKLSFPRPQYRSRPAAMCRYSSRWVATQSSSR